MISKNKLMPSRTPRPRLIKSLPLKGLLALSLILGASCNKAGPAITGCVVDAAKDGFDCVTYPSTKSFLPWSLGVFLSCASPEDIEDFLKACESQQILPITTCKLEVNQDKFQCTDPHGFKIEISLDEADNFFCASSLNWTRMKQRCSKPNPGFTAQTFIRYFHAAIGR